MGKPLPMQGEKSVIDHITVGLAKIAMALQSRAWEGGMVRKRMPTQGHILGFLSVCADEPVQLNDVAAERC